MNLIRKLMDKPEEKLAIAWRISVLFSHPVRISSISFVPPFDEITTYDPIYLLQAGPDRYIKPPEALHIKRFIDLRSWMIRWQIWEDTRDGEQ